MEADSERELRTAMCAALDLDATSGIRVSGDATLDSAYPVSDLATASVTTAAIAAAELVASLGFARPEVVVDRRLTDAWFGMALTPLGWSIPSPWDPIAGDYPSADGWIRLHTNAPHHRAAALRVLGVEGEREHVAAAVARWTGDELESAVVAEGGCAAVLRTPTEWAAHPQGAAVAREPLIALERTDTQTPDAAASTWAPSPSRPLAGLRVLDLTRVLAGPVATRLLAGLGADVLRLDPPDWDEPGVIPEVTIGKRTAWLDARDPRGHERLLALLADADVLVHGYRGDALELLGLGAAVRRAVRPGLVDVTLDAYGWSGPWATRRGFDSLVQMSSGIAGWGLRTGTAERPTPLPVQALDHATGYLMAAAVLSGLTRRTRDNRGTAARLSLARTAVELERAMASPTHARPIATPPAPTDSREPVTASIPLASALSTPWGAATLLTPPFSLGDTTLRWDRGPSELGSDAAAW